MSAVERAAVDQVGPSGGSGNHGGVSLGVAFLSMVLGPGSREQLGEARHRPAGGELEQDVLQVVPRIDAGHQAVGDDGVDDGSALAAGFTAREQVGLAPDSKSQVILPISSFGLWSNTPGTPHEASKSRSSTARNEPARRFSSARSRTVRAL